MTIAFFSNYLNHHQLPLAEILYEMDGVDYTFVSVTPIPDFRKELGYKDISAPFLLDITKSEDNLRRARELAIDADVAIFSTSKMNDFLIPRLKKGKLSFECAERWLKKDFKLNLLSINLWRHQFMYYRFGRNANLFMLCASAYAANDHYLLNSYKNRCYKWGYFTRIKPIDIGDILMRKRCGHFKLMWCSRFIGWKHPELVVKLASLLKSNNYQFEINMYGNGPQLSKIRKAIIKRELNDFVHLKGTLPNDEIIAAMQRHNVFLFTSDQNEGWGAVANEAMSNGCTLVGSDQIGSIPFLVKHGENGLIFKSKDVDSLYSAVTKLLDDPHLCERLSLNAYYDMLEMWSPQNAAERFLTLIDSLQKEETTPFEDGPCSLAVPLK